MRQKHPEMERTSANLERNKNREVSHLALTVEG
jgi:hypothetical protein